MTDAREYVANIKGRRTWPELEQSLLNELLEVVLRDYVEAPDDCDCEEGSMCSQCTLRLQYDAYFEVKNRGTT